MFFILSKIFVFLFSPISWIVGALIVGFFLKNQKWKKRMFLISFSLFLFFSNTFIGAEFIRAWEVPAVDSKSIKSYEVGIVLGGVLMYDYQLERSQFLRSSDRLWQAIKLYKQGKIRKIFFVGGSGLLNHPEDKEGVLVKQELLSLGIPESDILIENDSRNTYENAIFAKRILDSLSLSGPHLLITSGIHMKRSLACFEKAGMQVESFSTDRYTGHRRYEFDVLFIPNIYAFSFWDPLMHEYIGYVTYYLNGYL